MNRILLLSVIALLSGGNTLAEDYLLRLDAICHVDQPATDPKPKEKVLHSIEVVAQPKIPFHSKIQFENQTLILKGQIEPNETGGFIVDFQYRHTTDTGAKVPIAPNQFAPVLDVTAVATRIGLSLGETYTTSRLTSKSDSESIVEGKTVVKSQVFHKWTRVTLTKCEPPKN
jgi:hypothetical protein